MRGGRRQQRLGRARKIRAMLAWLDEELWFCGEGDANRGAGGQGKFSPGWRGPMKNYGFAGRATPTEAPAGQENPGQVGVARRRIMALQGGRRQQRRRRTGKIRARLAWPDGGKRLCGESDANKGADGPGKSESGWRGPTKNYGFAGRATPTEAPADRENPGQVGVARRR